MTRETDDYSRPDVDRQHRWDFGSVFLELELNGLDLRLGFGCHFPKIGHLRKSWSELLTQEVFRTLVGSTGVDDDVVLPTGGIFCDLIS